MLIRRIVDRRDEESPRLQRVQHRFATAGMDVGDLRRRSGEARGDMVEIDVVQLHDELVIGHTLHEVRAGHALRLDTALEVMAEALPTNVAINVDLKGRGYEREVAWSLRAYDLADRVLVSSMELESLRLVRRAAGEIRLGWSIPKATHDYLANPAGRALVAVVAPYYRWLTPGRAMRAVLAGFADAIMAQTLIVTPNLVEAVGYVGADLYIWTVDDASRMAELKTLGVTGIITNELQLLDAVIAGAYER